MENIILETSNLFVNYKNTNVLNNISIRINKGEVVALLGPNGAGKSTFLKTIFGLTPYSDGEIRVFGERLRPLPQTMVKKRISFVPQGRRVFVTMTVKENLEIGGSNFANKIDLRQGVEEAINFFPILKKKFRTKAGILSGGEQQMLSIARGLVFKPLLLLLDEPTLGLAPKIISEVFEKILELNSTTKTAVILVEHNLKSALEISTRAYVLNNGEVVANGDSKDQFLNEVIKKIFLG